MKSYGYSNENAQADKSNYAHFDYHATAASRHLAVAQELGQLTDASTAIEERRLKEAVAAGKHTALAEQYQAVSKSLMRRMQSDLQYETINDVALREASEAGVQIHVEQPVVAEERVEVTVEK